MIERFRPEEHVPARARYASTLHGGELETGAVTVGEVLDRAQAREKLVDEREAGTPAGKRRRGAAHWAGWVSALVVMGVLVGVAIIAVLKFLNGPVEAKPDAQTLNQMKASVVPTPVTQVLAGQTVEFSYPGVFDQVRKMQDTTLDSYYIASKSEPGRTIAVAVVALPSNRIDDDSGYKFRLLHKESYKESREKLGGEEVVIMTKNDNTEQTLFWPHKGKSLNISITSTAPRDKVSEFMNVIKPTIRWRQ